MCPSASMTRFVICFLPDLLRDFARHRPDARKKPPVSRKPIRIAVLHFSHETVTFLKNDTTLADFIYPGSPAKGETLLAYDRKSYMGGFVKVAREFDEVELVGIESPLWPKTGTGSGWITQETYETFAGKMISEIAAQGRFDGVYLCLHGAMGVRGVARPEAELARRVRAGRRPRGLFLRAIHPPRDEGPAAPH